MAIVELVMRIEEEFDLAPGIAKTESIAVPRTAGDLLKIAVTLLRAENRLANESAVWEIVKGIVSDVLRVDPSAVTRESRLIEDLGAD